MLPEYTWFQNARLQAIEILSYWQGRINTRDITEIFGISRQIAQRDMSTYLSLAPGNLSYKKSERSYLVTTIFKPLLTQGTIEEYLALKSDGVDILGEGHLSYAPKPQFTIDPVKFRVVLQSIRNEQILQLRYQSLNHPDGVIRRLQPHTLVYSGFRWHIRAYCFIRKDFRDFSLARIMDKPGIDGEFDRRFTIKKDKLWNGFIVLRFAANPNLPSTEQKLIESEFGLKGGVLKIKTRKALVNYTLQNYQITMNAQKERPRRDRLVLDNQIVVEPFMWDYS